MKCRFSFVWFVFFAVTLLIPLSATETEFHKLSIRVKSVELSAPIVEGRRYELQVSEDLRNWTRLDDPFTAASPVFVRDVTISSRPQYYRLVELIPVYAPASLEGSSYLLALGSGGRTVHFTSGSAYAITQNGSIQESGLFSATRRINKYTVILTPQNSPGSTLLLDYTSTEGGIATLSSEAGQETAPFKISPGINFAPAGLNGKKFRVVLATGPFSGNTYDILFVGDVSGDFTIFNGSEGSGTFVYSRDEESSNLIMNFLAPVLAAGDQDNFNLIFSSSTSATITGGSQTTRGFTHTTGQGEGPPTGTFNQLIEP